MAEFLTGLFESIFTPGPTPPLVRATNAAFAALQLVLLVLLAATRSVHFVVLSVLCAGLWWSINWFISELEAAKAAEKKKEGDKGATGAGSAGTGHNASGSVKTRRRRVRGTGGDGGDGSGTETEEMEAAPQGVEREATIEPEPKKDLRPPGRPPAAVLAKRKSFGGDVSGTDSEWDKVSETEGMGESGAFEKVDSGGS